VRPFLNPWFSSDHTKVFLVDGTHAWLGGMNLGREYRYEWHDVMVELQGPVVASLEDEFRRDWAHEGPLGDLAYVAELARGPRDATETQPSDRWIQMRLLPTKTAWKPFSARSGRIQIAGYIYSKIPPLTAVIIALVRAEPVWICASSAARQCLDQRTSNLVLANCLLGMACGLLYPQTHEGLDG
jgi:phosphatidylserine/phosphatidylglycerophosphate/cardiolipin synthase-like enzyme